MCLGGPNHCRVGQMGSQSFICRLIVVHYWQMLMCILDLYVDIAVACVMICRHVVAQSIMSCYPCTHAHTKKKKNCTCYKRFVVVTRRIVTYGIRAGSTRDLGSLWISLT
jgi:hypothetical protein